MQYAPLKTARAVLGPDHPDVLQRAARTVTRFVRNFAVMAHVFRRVFPKSYEVPHEDEPTRQKSWFWPRNFFFNYPKRHAQIWHQPSVQWKRAMMIHFCPPELVNRPVSRYELFCIQKNMPEEAIIEIGW
jgi:hypothetical protein